MFDIDALQQLIRRLTLRDAAELLLIGAAVYAIMRFLRGTRGARLLRGFVLLLVVTTLVIYLLAGVFELERIKVLYFPFVTAMFLIALVAFQPELRRALIRLGAARWFGDVSRQVDQVIDEVVSAVGYLAKNKIGALIAFQRSTEFGALLETGCKLDADVTERLLTTIFWPGSALHDMGVVIAHGRVAAAAVQFPLTDSTDLDPSLGSRHRAALGLSEETDSIIVVVSEETGIISVVEGGKLHRFLTADSLRQMLKEMLGRVAEGNGQAPG